MVNTLITIQHLLSMIYSQKIATGDCYISGVDYCCKRNSKAPLWVNAKVNIRPTSGNILACDICDDNSHTNIVVSFFFRKKHIVSDDSAQKKVSRRRWATHSYPAGFTLTNYPVDVRLAKTYTNVNLRDIATIVAEIQTVFSLFGV